MRKYWDRMFGLNYDRSIWIDSEDLGKEKDIKHKHKHYLVKIPESINEKIILRLKGLGKTKNNETGDLLLHIRLNKGADLRKDLWLSETSAKDGANKILGLDSKRIRITIPPKSYHGLIIRLRGLGELLRFNWRYPFLQRKRGDLLVKLFVYPDKITPKYGSFDTLETDEMALEGWIYRRIDQVVSKIPKSSFPINPVQADTVAAQFNETGWKGVFSALVAHFGLKKLDIEINPSNSISLPGSCQKSIKYENEYPVGKKYTITINTKFIDNPFFVAAIMAHEICHVV
ncbi:MAG: hypothetical protein HGA53_03990, partial [Anaerolineaceae bacterium]|nr:hypothetical protein [Anaerolineaceae bacterium]